MKVPLNEFDGKVTYGQKRRKTGIIFGLQIISTYKLIRVAFTSQFRVFVYQSCFANGRSYTGTGGSRDSSSTVLPLLFGESEENLWGTLVVHCSTSQPKASRLATNTFFVDCLSLRNKTEIIPDVFSLVFAPFQLVIHLVCLPKKLS